MGIRNKKKRMHFNKISVFCFAQTDANFSFTDYMEIPDVQFNVPDDVITNDFPLFRPPEMENTGYKEIEDYVDYDVYGMIGARSKKLPNGDKNFDDLVEMLDYYNDEWDVKAEYLTDYGCNCRNNLDRRQKGLGNPYGVVDMGCHVWKQCLKCAESLYGEECTAQNIKYNVKLVSGQYECQNAPGTCRKAICECDLAFAQFTGKKCGRMEYEILGDGHGWLSAFQHN